MSEHRTYLTDAIGGYFQLELPDRKNSFHSAALALNSCRSALEVHLREARPKHLHLPYFTCDVLLEPIERCKIPYSFYQIDRKLEFSTRQLDLEEGHAVICTNYFGLKDSFIASLSEDDCAIIVDNAQAYFSQPLGHTATIYSPRKFVGVPDGGYLYSDSVKAHDAPRDHSSDRCSHLLIRLDSTAEEGYEEYKRNDEKVGLSKPAYMSALTESLLRSVNHERVQQQRISNFHILQRELEPLNQLNLELAEESTPLCYPFLIEKGNELRAHLNSIRIYTPVYWPNERIRNPKGSFEEHLTENLVCLPIDQRYGETEMKLILRSVSAFLKST